MTNTASITNPPPSFPLEDSPATPKSKMLRRTALGTLIAGGVAGLWLGANSYRSRSFEKACDSAKQQRDWRTLRTTAKEWVNWDPNASTGWWRAAEAAQELEDLEDLAYCLGMVPKSDPKVAFAYAEKANLEWTVLNRPLEALKTSQQTLELNPHIVEIHSRLISFYAMTLQRTEMLNAIRRAMSEGAEPKEAYSYIIMADVLSFVNGDDVNSRWLAAVPDESMFKVGLGINTAMNLSQTKATAETPEIVSLNEQARQQIQWFLDQLPGNPQLLAYLLHQAYLAGNTEEVARLLLQIDERSVSDHMTWVYRGWYHATLDENIQEAEEAIQEAIRLHPVSPLARHEYASLLRKWKRPETAREQRIAAYGRELRSQILQLKSAADQTPALILQVQSYAEECGDELIASAAATRLRNLTIQPA